VAAAMHSAIAAVASLRRFMTPSLWGDPSGPHCGRTSQDPPLGGGSVQPGVRSTLLPRGVSARSCSNA
jgi:hypothetical protein